MFGLKRAIDEKSKLEGEKYRIATETSLLINRHESRSNETKSLDAKITELRNQWTPEEQKQFIEPSPDSFICPTCEQSLPERKRQEKIAQMRSNFENNKAQFLSTIRKA